MSQKQITQTDNIDEIYKEIGEFGKYQFLLLILLSLTATLPALTSYSFIFTGATPDYRCKIPTFENDTYEVQNEYHKHLIDLYIPFKNSYNSSYDGCHFREFDLNQNGTLVKCDKWVYSKKYYEKTVVTELNLVCNRESIKSTFSSLYFVGYFFTLIIGFLGDRYGRKIVSYFLIIFCCLSSILTAILINVPFSEEAKIILFGALRLIIGIMSNTYAMGMVLAIELIGPSYRLVATNTFYFFYILGEFIVILFGFIFRNYHHFEIAIASFLTVYVFYFWIIPESPRYLLVRGKTNEALKIFEKIARFNKKQLKTNKINIENNPSVKVISVNDSIDSKKDLTIEEKLPAKNKTYKDKIKLAFKSRKFLTRFGVTILIWFGNMFVYTGVSYNIGSFGGNPYLNNTYSSIVELVAIFSCFIMLEKFGRKKPFSIMFFLAGVSLLCIAFVPPTMTDVITGLGLVGKFSISFSYNSVYIVTAESYPTEVRNTALSTCSALARIGSVIAPYVQLLGSQWFPLPYVIYGSVAILGAILYLIFLPETKGMKLMDKFEEMFD